MLVLFNQTFAFWAAQTALDASKGPTRV